MIPFVISFAEHPALFDGVVADAVESKSDQFWAKIAQAAGLLAVDKCKVTELSLLDLSLEFAPLNPPTPLFIKGYGSVLDWATQLRLMTAIYRAGLGWESRGVFWQVLVSEK